MKRILHVAAGSIALMTISTFWVSTVLSELLATHETIATVKTAVLWGMLILIPAMAIAGATGSIMGKGWRLREVGRKTKRMKIIAATGILILLPSAVFLALRAQAGQFDSIFYSLQAVELVAGATNITLLGRNMKDGMALRTRRIKSGA